MKITNIDTLIVDAGWRPWTFVKVETDEGITGWGECFGPGNIALANKFIVEKSIAILNSNTYLIPF